MSTVSVEIQWLQDADEALRRAQSEQKLVFLDFFAPQ